MNLENLVRRMAVCMLFVVLGMTTAMAGVTHVVNRGETLQSIAQKYGVTTERIIQANPQAAQFIYVGMELNIPEGNAPQQAPMQVTPQTRIVGSDNTIGSVQNTQASSNYANGDNLIQYGVGYVANFSDDGKGFYGLFFEGLSESGWGAFFSAGASYGITKPGQLQFRLGPAYGSQISNSIWWSVPLTFNVSTTENIDKMRYYKGKDQPTKSMKTVFGFALTPKIVLKVDRAHLNLGLDVNYNFEKKFKTEYVDYPEIGNYTRESKAFGKVYVGFFVGIGL